MAEKTRGIQFQTADGADKAKQSGQFVRRTTTRFPDQISRSSFVSGHSRESQVSSASGGETPRTKRKTRMSLFGSLGRKSFTASGSVMMERLPTLRFEPTYRLFSKYPFNTEYVQQLLQSHLERSFNIYEYTVKGADRKCQRVTINLLTRVKQLNFDRYRLICIIMMGQKFHQDVKVATSFMWDKTMDKWAHCIYERPDFFAIGLVYGIYYD